VGNENEYAASNSLKRYQGKFVIYVDSLRKFAGTDKAFLEKIESDFQLVKSLKIPNWPAMNDKLYLFARRQRDKINNKKIGRRSYLYFAWRLKSAVLEA